MLRVLFIILFLAYFCGMKPDLDPVVELLAALARDKVYGPLDMLSRVEDNDEFYMKLAREALYSAMRYVSTD